MILVSPEHLYKSHFGLHQSKAPINWKWMKYIHVVLYMIIGIAMAGKIDTWFLNMTPSNAISRSVPKGHVSHLNDLVPVSRGKPFWVKPAIRRITKSSLSRNRSFFPRIWTHNKHCTHFQGSFQKAGSWCKLQTAASTPVPWKRKSSYYRSTILQICISTSGKLINSTNHT